MAYGDATLVFTDRDVWLIAKSLPNEVSPRRLELLPHVLREWSRNELREHLLRESAATIRKRVERMEGVEHHARGLLQALEALDDRDRAAIAGQMLPSDLWLNRKGGEIRGLTHLIREENSFLAALAAAAPAAWKQGRGRPRNITSYLVTKDAAAIFEWLTKIEATRQVSRSAHQEAGPFCGFLAGIWPVVFGKGDDGLPAALKNWAKYRERERSALIANIAFRHPEWRVFDD